MRVDHLSLANFRNYATAELPLGAGPQLLIGRNGQGKTNLVEAISYFDSLSSHRVSSDQPLIRANAATGTIRMRVAVRDRSVTLELEFQRGKPKRAQINGNAAKPRELMQWFTCVVFAPEDLMIARGDPAHRRDFLDAAIVTRNPVMAGVFRDYERVLKQRNSLLKSARGGASRKSVEATLPVWDAQLAGLGSRIVAERRALITLLAPRVGTAYHQLVENDHRPTLALEETFIGGRDAPVGEVDPRLRSAGDGDGASGSASNGAPNVSRETSAGSTSDHRAAHPGIDEEPRLQRPETEASRAEDAQRTEAQSSQPLAAGSPIADSEAAANSGAARPGGNESVTRADIDVSRETLIAQFESALRQARTAELDRGLTLVGPHRDELHLNLNGLPVKGYASHGETWSFVLALRLAFAGLLREESYTGDPVVLLDDVFAELDQRRRMRLMDAVGDYEQIVVTAAVPEDIPNTVPWNVARIDRGQVVAHSEAHRAEPRGE